MDFQKLLQQAKVKQAVVEKKLVQQKTQKEEEIEQKKRVEFQKQRETSLKLNKLKEEAVKKQLKYKGLHRPSQALPSSSHNANKTQISRPSLIPSGKDQSSISKEKPTPSKTSQSQDRGNQDSSFVKPKKLSIPSKSGDRLAQPKSQKSISHNSVPCSSKPKSQKSISHNSVPCSSKPKTATKTPTAKSSQSKAPVVKFDDLIKMAAMNKDSVGEERVPKEGNGLIVKPRCQESFPVGKSLVEKISGRTRGTKQAHDDVLSNCSVSLTKSIDSANSAPNRGHHSLPGASSTGKLETSMRQKAAGHMPTTKASPSKSGHSTHQQTSQSASIKSNPSQNINRSNLDRTSKAPINTFRNVCERLKNVSTSHPANNKVGPPRPKPKPKSVEARAFYGSAAANILRQKNKSTGGAPFRYTSCWVDEMKDIVGNSDDFDGYSEEDDEDDLDGFVVGSDDDFIDDSEAGDYSSHIREIFGYDKRKFASEKFDDRLMESSYAQQEFEEARSARIGKLEDEEDIHQQQEKLQSQKKRKLNSHVTSYGSRSRSGLKQSKISFR